MEPLTFILYISNTIAALGLLYLIIKTMVAKHISELNNKANIIPKYGEAATQAPDLAEAAKANIIPKYGEAATQASDLAEAAEEKLGSNTIGYMHKRTFNTQPGSADRLFIALWEETVGATGEEPNIHYSHCNDPDISAFQKDNTSKEMQAFYVEYGSAGTIEEKAALVLADCIRRTKMLNEILIKHHDWHGQGCPISVFPAGDACDFIAGTCRKVEWSFCDTSIDPGLYKADNTPKRN